MNQKPLKIRFVELRDSGSDPSPAETSVAEQLLNDTDSREEYDSPNPPTSKTSANSKNFNPRRAGLVQILTLFLLGNLTAFALWEYLPRESAEKWVIPDAQLLASITKEVTVSDDFGRHASTAEPTVAGARTNGRPGKNVDMPIAPAAAFQRSPPSADQFRRDLNEPIFQFAAFEKVGQRAPEIFRPHSGRYQLLEANITNQQDAFFKLAERDLILRLQDESLRDASMVELQHRGWTPPQLATALDLVSASSERRIEVMRKLRTNKDFNAQPWLEWLSQDQDPLVQAEALRHLGEVNLP
ncbi:MAG: hypothetical protein AAF483_17735 [Planctomycetota bacterium]